MDNFWADTLKASMYFLRITFWLILIFLAVARVGSAESSDSTTKKQVIATGQEKRIAIELSPEELEWLDEHPVVEVAALTDFPPIQYTDSFGTYKGMATDILKLLAEKIGFKIRPHFAPWSEGLIKVRNRELDLLPEVKDTPKRREFLHFSRPYIDVPHVIAIRPGSDSVRSLEELSGKIVVVEKDYYTRGILNKIPDIRQQVVADTVTALTAVINGEADAYLGNIALMSHMTERHHLPRLKMVFPTDAPSLEVNGSKAYVRPWRARTSRVMVGSSRASPP